MSNARENIENLIGFGAQRRADSQELARLVQQGKGNSARARKLAERIYVASADPAVANRGKGRKRKGVA